jgi:hypothetical protein
LPPRPAAIDLETRVGARRAAELVGDARVELVARLISVGPSRASRRARLERSLKHGGGRLLKLIEQRRERIARRCAARLARRRGA